MEGWLFKDCVMLNFMIDLKKSYENVGSKKARFWPNWYSVNSVQDFLLNKNSVKPTCNFSPMGILFHNSALVQLENSVIFDEIEYELGRISDLSGSLDFPMEGFFAFLNNTNPIEDGQNFYHVILKYSPKKR